MFLVVGRIVQFIVVSRNLVHSSQQQLVRGLLVVVVRQQLVRIVWFTVVSRNSLIQLIQFIVVGSSQWKFSSSSSNSISSQQELSFQQFVGQFSSQQLVGQFSSQQLVGISFVVVNSTEQELSNSNQLVGIQFSVVCRDSLVHSSHQERVSRSQKLYISWPSRCGGKQVICVGRWRGKTVMYVHQALGRESLGEGI